MTRLLWDTRPYELGLDRGVFYPKEGPGEAWTGLVSVEADEQDSETKTRYLDGALRTRRRSLGSFSATLEAYSQPPSLSEYEGVKKGWFGQQRKLFGLSYRVAKADGYFIHLVYNAMAAPVAINRETHSESATAPTKSWHLDTRPMPLPGGKVSAHLIVDTAKAYSWTVEALEALIYGTESEDAMLPDPLDVLDVFETNSILRVVDNGDGTWTATGPDSAIQLLPNDTFQITWDSAVIIDDVSYTISSL